MPVGIYPPTLKSTQPAFLTSESDYRINFTLQSMSSFSSIGHIQIRIVYQASNISAVNTDTYPDGIIYKDAKSIDESEKPTYSILINSNSDIAGRKWIAGTLYKVQIRFGKNAKYTSLSSFADWKKEQIADDAFSEWSTVMVIKAIEKPTVYLKNADATSSDVIASEKFEISTTPTFEGGYTEGNGNNKEAVEKYKFDLYLGEYEIGALPIETSGWLQHDGNINSLDKYRFKTVLDNGEQYSVIYTISTINGYEESTNPYLFTVALSYLSMLEGVTLKVEDDTEYCIENGCVNIYVTSTELFNGNYVITRASEKSNYAVWEDIGYYGFFNQEMKDTLICQDFTIECGIRYQYAIQLENSEGLRTSPVYEESNKIHQIDFEYSYLYRDGIQLKLKYDTKLSSFKKTTLRSKQDTLGDRYAHLVSNGSAYYAEFPISGLITFHMDNDQTFFTKGAEGYYYKGDLVLPSRKFLEEGAERKPCDSGDDTPTAANSLTIDTNLSADSTYVERIFRDKAEEFLNDFEYKLFRSPTEGNIIVGLMNVSLTPKTELGRMIYSFSATAYEVMENTLENLDSIGIVNIGSFAEVSADDFTLSFGQIGGIYRKATESPIDIYNMIKEQEEISLGGGYKMYLRKVTSIWVEQYPPMDYTGKFLELNAIRAELVLAGEDTTEVDAEIAELRALEASLAGPLSTITKLNVNGSNVVMAANKVYNLNEPVTSLYLISAMCPILVNYTCELTQGIDDTIGVVSSIDTSRIWGQISGIFTGTDSVLKTYNYNYMDSEIYRIFNPILNERAIIRDSSGNIIVDSTNYNVYKTINILDIIKEETQKQVERMYSTTFKKVGTDITDGTIYYTFNDITLFDIEADAGTILLIGTSADGSDAKEFVVGVSESVKGQLATPLVQTSRNYETRVSKTNRLVFSPLEHQIKYIALKNAQFCIINYKTLTNQMRMAGKAESK